MAIHPHGKPGGGGLMQRPDGTEGVAGTVLTLPIDIGPVGQRVDKERTGPDRLSVGHASASFLAMEGAPMRIAMQILGHNDIATTAEVYQHISEEGTREATGKVADALWG